MSWPFVVVWLWLFRIRISAKRAKVPSFDGLSLQCFFPPSFKFHIVRFSSLQQFFLLLFSSRSLFFCIFISQLSCLILFCVGVKHTRQNGKPVETNQQQECKNRNILDDMWEICVAKLFAVWSISSDGHKPQRECMFTNKNDHVCVCVCVYGLWLDELMAQGWLALTWQADPAACAHTAHRTHRQADRQYAALAETRHPEHDAQLHAHAQYYNTIWNMNNMKLLISQVNRF